jgi:hypothetical protein
MQKRFPVWLGNVFAFFESDTSSAHGHGCRNSEYIMTETNIKLSGVEIPQRTCHEFRKPVCKFLFGFKR